MNLMWVAILFVFLAYVFRKRSIISWVFIAFILVYVLIWLLPLQYIEEYVPNVVIEESTEKVSNTGAFVLSTGVSPLTPQEFIVTESTGIVEIQDYVKETTKPIVILINEGQDTVYTKNLGVFSDLESEQAANDILSIYTTWKASGVLPSKVTYVRLGEFYIKR